jgi:hypothetical protein
MLLSVFFHLQDMEKINNLIANIKSRLNNIYKFYLKMKPITVRILIDIKFKIYKYRYTTFWVEELE